MANFTLEQLLQYPPYEALLIAFNDTHGTTLNPRFVQLDKVVASEGPVARVRIKATSVLPNKEDQRFSNQTELQVTRLDLADLFNQSFAIPYSGEIVSHDVARVISQRTGVLFEEADFVTEVITPTNNVLKAAPTSLRWYGQLTIVPA